MICGTDVQHAWLVQYSVYECVSKMRERESDRASVDDYNRPELHMIFHIHGLSVELSM